MNIPSHIAIIMDGNGRWANQRGLPRTAGHKEGSRAVEKIVSHCADIGVQTLTLYAFSTENWSRPKKEVDSILNLLRNYLSEMENYAQKNVKLIVLGDTTVLDEDLRQRIFQAQQNSSKNTGLTLNIALNYGGRQEILEAAKAIARQVAEKSIQIEDIDEDFFAGFLYTSGQSDPDLIIRPSGEQRLSNFLLWQCAYSEFVFMDVLWPDFTPQLLDEAIEQYGNRSRRFGGI